MRGSRRRFMGGISAGAVLSLTGSAMAQKKYGDGASDGEIRIGHCGPCSGPASAYGVIGKSIEAYWKSVNDGGGINGRIVRMVTCEMADPTVESQIIQLKDSGANVLFNIAAPKFAAQAIRKMADVSWKPAHYLNCFFRASRSAPARPAISRSRPSSSSASRVTPGSYSATSCRPKAPGTLVNCCDAKAAPGAAFRFGSAAVWLFHPRRFHG